MVASSFTRFSRAILLSETVFNSDNLFLHVLKAIARQEPFFKALVTKPNRSSDVQVTIYYCEKPICMGCTVTQLARESVGLCPFRGSHVREFEFISHSKGVNRIIKINHAHNLHVKMLVFGPFTIRT